MAYRASTGGTYGAYDRPGAAALEYAAMAEDALDRGDLVQCGAALERARECAVAAATDCVNAPARHVATDHIHLVVRSLTGTVDRVCDGLAAKGDCAAADTRTAIRTLRSTINRIDPTAADRVDRYPVAVGHRCL